MQVKVYNQEGQEVGTARLPNEIFGLAFNADLVWQVATTQGVNRRQVSAHTKTRGDVRGGGRKPWRQKGTGRARHGSIRSPLWRGGGVTFGPRKEKKFEKIIPKKMRRKALLMVLSAKARDKELVVLDELKLEKAKTKLMAQVLQKVLPNQKSRLIALPELDRTLILAGRNIPKTRTMQARDLNALDLLQYHYLVLPKESIKVIKKTFIKQIWPFYQPKT